jgi:hypothetical protein
MELDLQSLFGLLCTAVFFNNGKPKTLFQETPLGNNSDIFNEKKTTIITQTEIPF